MKRLVLNTLTPHSSPHKLWILIQFELSKFFSTSKGLWSIILFVVLWGLSLSYLINDAATTVYDPSFRAFISGLLGGHRVGGWFAWPLAQLAVCWLIVLYLFPMLVIFTSNDMFTTDKHNKTLRFLLIRASREQIFFSRILSHLIIIFIFALVAVASCLVVTTINQPDQWLTALTNSGYILTNVIIISAPFTALMALVSLAANSAKQAGIIAMLLLTLANLLVIMLTNYIPSLAVLSYVIPGVQLSDMIAQHGAATFSLSAIPIIQTLVLLALGNYWLKRSQL